MSKSTYRRLMGCLIGGLIGLIFVLTSMLVRKLVLPEIPLHFSPLGFTGNTLIGLAAGVLLGLVSAWTEASPPGPIIAAGGGAVGFLVVGFITGMTPLFMVPATVLTTIFLMLPFGAMMLPLTALMRVAVNQWTDYRKYPILQPRRWSMTVILIVLAFGAGNLARFNPAARIMLERTHALIQEGLQSASLDALPAPLRGPEMVDFIGSAGQTFELEWQNQNLVIYQIPRPALSEADMAVVIAHFDNGWVLVCLYPNTELDARCRGFDEVPRPASSY